MIFKIYLVICSLVVTSVAASPGGLFSEKASLEAFFKQIVVEEGGFNVLFGTKPMALSGFYEKPELGNAAWRFFFSQANLQTRKGYQIWKKEKSKHVFPNYYLVELPNDPNYTVLLLIHKKRFLLVVEHYLQEFQKVLGEKITPAEVLSRMTSGEYSYAEALKDNHFLLGLLLGYGKENASLFQRHMDLDPEKNIFSLTIPRPSASFHSREEERDYIVQTYCDFNTRSVPPDFNFLFLNDTIAFMKNKKSPITKRIDRDSKLAYRRALHYYADGDFTTKTLDKLKEIEMRDINIK